MGHNSVARYNRHLTPSYSCEGRAPMYLPPEILKTVLFIGIMDDGKFIPKATAFAVYHDYQGFTFSDLVTAEHVITGLHTKGHKIYIRANLVGGSVREFEVPFDKWHCYPNDEGERLSDVAAVPINPVGVYDDVPYHLDMMPISLTGDMAICAIESQMKDHGPIGISDEMFSAGLFRSHYGAQRNVPIIRMGHIIAMPDEPIWTKYAGFIDAYLVQMNSIAGLSGSPAFVTLTSKQTGDKRFYFLGLVHGHFDVQNLNDDVVSEDIGSGLGSINTGIGVVIPVEKVLKTVFQESLAKLRQVTVDAERAKLAASADVDLSDAPRPKKERDESDGLNPSHREDFMSLLGEAATTKPQDDQT